MNLFKLKMHKVSGLFIFVKYKIIQWHYYFTMWVVCCSHIITYAICHPWWEIWESFFHTYISIHIHPTGNCTFVVIELSLKSMSFISLSPRETWAWKCVKYKIFVYNTIPCYSEYHQKYWIHQDILSSL